MDRQPVHQLQIIWEDIPSPISIPEETRKRLTDLLGDLLLGYWEKRKGNYNALPTQNRRPNHLSAL